MGELMGTGPGREQVSEDHAENEIRDSDFQRVRQANVARHKRILRQEPHSSTENRESETERDPARLEPFQLFVTTS